MQKTQMTKAEQRIVNLFVLGTFIAVMTFIVFGIKQDSYSEHPLIPVFAKVILGGLVLWFVSVFFKFKLRKPAQSLQQA